MNQNARAWVAMQRGGLCNNLKCLLSTIRLASRDAVPVLNSSHDLQELFVNLEYIKKQDISASMQKHQDWRFLVFPEDPIEVGFSSRRESKGFSDADAQGRNIDHEFDLVPDAMRAIYLDVIASLIIRPELTSLVETFSVSEMTDDTVSIHMRTWMTDHWDKAPNRHKHYFSFEKYVELVEKYEQVFISSDNQEYLDRLLQKYGDRVKHLGPQPQLTNTQMAFVNLMLLSKNRRLIGSSLSTFTEMAWWLGGCKAEVELIGLHGQSL